MPALWDFLFLFALGGRLMLNCSCKGVAATLRSRYVLSACLGGRGTRYVLLTLSPNQGTLVDGRIIDTSLTRDPLVIELGQKQVIPGM